MTLTPAMLCRADHLHGGETRQQQAALGRPCQDVAHEVAGAAACDVDAELVFTDEKGRIQYPGDLGQLHGVHPSALMCG